MPMTRVSVPRVETFGYQPTMSDQSKRQKCEISNLHAALFKNTSDDLLPVRLFLNVQTSTKDNESEKNNRKGAVPHLGKARSSTLTHRHRIQSNTMVPTVPESAVGMGVMCQALLDSGSLAGDFINGNMLSALNGVQYLRSDGSESRVQ